MENGHQNKVSFIIVTYNSDATIIKCIESISAHFANTNNHKNNVVSAIVIDNNSTDKTVALLKKLKKRYSWLQIKLHDKNIGFGSANNIGFDTQASDYYVLINADAWLVADSISPIVSIMNTNHNIAICGIPLIYPDGSPQTYTYAFSSWHRWLFHIFKIQNLVKKLIKIKAFSRLFQLIPYSRAYVKNKQTPSIDLSQMDTHTYKNTWADADWVCGAGMVISRQFIKESKGFDPNIFLYGEDEDICIQAHQTGYRVITADVAPMVHMLGWENSGFNQVVADLKFTSLNYFIEKNIKTKTSQYLMKILLPIYVYGFRNFSRVFLSKKIKNKVSLNEKTSKKTAWCTMLKQLIICQSIEEKNQLLDRIIHAKGPRVLSFLNAHAANLLWTDEGFRKTLLNSDYLLRDGSGIHLFLSLLKIPPGLNLNGTDLIPEILDKMNKNSKIAVYGTKGEYLKEGVAAIKKKGFNNITYENGFHDEAYYLKKYQAQKPDLVILAMGMPKQEKISINLRNATNEDKNVLIINGGGIIDFISEKVPRSPEFMRQMGIEWLFRLVRDPLRLWKRNLGSILFLIRAFFFSRNM